jgi:hypothetical protein
MMLKAITIPTGSNRNSFFAATTEAAEPGHSPIVLVMFATFSDSPAIPVSAGKVRNVPPPAIALTAEAMKETKLIKRIVIVRSRRRA